jgi:hypothetical protein
MSSCHQIADGSAALLVQLVAIRQKVLGAVALGGSYGAESRLGAWSPVLLRYAAKLWWPQASATAA